MFQGMLSFLGPAALVPMGDALMSLVDTICIGQFAGTSQLAALGPANLVFTFAQYMLQSLQVAALSLVAQHVRKGQFGDAEDTLSCSLLLAFAFGVTAMCILEAAPESIIRSTGIKDLELLPLSTEYMRIRALAQPAVLLTMVAQSGLLAQQDSATPAIAVVLATLVSLAGSVLFVAGLGWGLAGAAVTTVATQWCGAAALLWALRVRGRLRVRFGLPRREVLGTLLGTMGPLSITYIAKNVCYIIIQSTAAGLHLLWLAAHQAVFAIWNLMAWTATPFEQAAMTFLPGSKGWRKAAGVQLLLALGLAVGSAVGLVLGLAIALAPQLMTRDATVWPLMASVAPLAGFSMVLIGADVVSSGINIAFGDAAYVARSFVVTLVLLAAYMAAVRAMDWGLMGVWGGIVLFFGVRALQSTGRVLLRHMGAGQSDQQQAQQKVEPRSEGPDDGPAAVAAAMGG